jgi:tRNA pseudouridine(55) synthase
MYYVSYMSPHNTKKNDIGQPNIVVGQGIFHFWKEAGETLAVLLRRFREEQGYGADEKITYAGRLDPMAAGIVPLLVGDARFQKDRLQAQAKTYEVDVLLGISTDTGDMLGLVARKALDATFSQKQIEQVIEQLKAVKELPYPEYSSRPVEGKPLFVHARAGRKVALPLKKVSVYSLELRSMQKVRLGEVLDTAIATIEKVQGDFRQQETVGQWNTLKASDGTKSVLVVSITATVSSGTYMRSLAERMGEVLEVPALACTIVRTGIDN